jgi:hypothetical protein
MQGSGGGVIAFAPDIRDGRMLSVSAQRKMFADASRRRLCREHAEKN